MTEARASPGVKQCQRCRCSRQEYRRKYCSESLSLHFLSGTRRDQCRQRTERGLLMSTWGRKLS
ncbi:hypothetical protein B0H12DRAFT_1147480 [Mycena haematopus]|nr:hypothetical protein B0H12DRAFT_1147480 [Mycena haematopus]